jgi:hypothetical protein
MNTPTLASTFLQGLQSIMPSTTFLLVLFIYGVGCLLYGLPTALMSLWFRLTEEKKWGRIKSALFVALHPFSCASNDRTVDVGNGITQNRIMSSNPGDNMSFWTAGGDNLEDFKKNPKVVAWVVTVSMLGWPLKLVITTVVILVCVIYNFPHWVYLFFSFPFRRPVKFILMLILFAVWYFLPIIDLRQVSAFEFKPMVPILQAASMALLVLVALPWSKMKTPQEDKV